MTLGRTRVYLSGNTAGVPEIRELKEVDVAFICMDVP